MKNVEDVYPLSPMQGVMLFHALSSPVDDALQNQFCYELIGQVDLPALAVAWQKLVDRHPILRTGFVWEDLKEPLQVVRRKVTLPVTLLDWSDRTKDEQDAAFAELTRADRASRFPPGEVPLMRVTLIERGPDHAWLVWSSHHLLLDRWCLSTVFADLFSLYHMETTGTLPARSALGPVRRYRDYVAWIQSRDQVAAELHWKQVLRGFRAASRITSPRAGAVLSEGRITLQSELTADCRSFVRSHRLTLSNLVQGAWSLTLNHFLGRADVVFGASVSGRPPDLVGVESIVGSFINNVPVRALLRPEVELVPWLATFRDAQQERLPFEHVALVDLQSWSELPAAEMLFDHLLIWLAPTETPSLHGLRLEGLSGTLATAYPLTLSVSEFSDALEIAAVCGDGFASVAPLSRILSHLRSTLEWIVDTKSARDDPRLLRLVPGFCDDSSSLSDESGADSREVESVVAALAGSRLVGTVAEPVAGGREAIGDSILRAIVYDEWKAVLGLETVASTDNFFDLGGNSLAAARLHAGIVASTRLVVPLLALFRGPTPGQMVQTLQEGDWPISADVVTPLRTRGERVPLFCIASPEVNTVGYALLARHLDEDQPVYVVQTPPSTGVPRRLSPSALLELADQYVAAVEAMQPRGDLQLIGMCSGSHVALEMAQKLKEKGRTPAFVGIINTWAFYTRSRSYRVVRIGHWFQHYSGRLRLLVASDGEGGVLATARAVFSKGRTLLDRRLRSRACTPSLPAGNRDSSGGRQTSAAGNPWLDEVGWEHDDVGRAKYPGVVTIFRIKKSQAGRIRDHGLGWGKHAEQVEVEMLPGDDHDAILREPGVRDLAVRVQQSLQAGRENSIS